MCAEPGGFLIGTMPFPEIVGRSVRSSLSLLSANEAEIGDPLAIGSLERYCVTHSTGCLKLPKFPAKGGRVAVIGGGFSGMTAALDLGRKGRSATLITGDASIGGTCLTMRKNFCRR